MILDNADVCIIIDALREQKERSEALAKSHEAKGNMRIAIARRDIAKRSDVLLQVFAYADSVDVGNIHETKLQLLLEENAPTYTLMREMASFPHAFGLRTHEGRFRVSHQNSYVNDDDKIVLYVQKAIDGVWTDFCKTSPQELREMLREPS